MLAGEQRGSRPVAELLEVRVEPANLARTGTGSPDDGEVKAERAGVSDRPVREATRDWRSAPPGWMAHGQLVPPAPSGQRPTSGWVRFDLELCSSRSDSPQGGKNTTGTPGDRLNVVDLFPDRDKVSAKEFESVTGAFL
jgi:hypothetical protein